MLATREEPEGALFCDGQFVDTGDNMNECAEWIRGELEIDIDGWVDADADCEGDTCRVDAAAGCTCANGPGTPTPPTGAAAAVIASLAMLGFLARRRRTL